MRAGRDERPALPPFAILPVLALALAKLALDLPFAHRYGWHRDEVYYLASGNHLQLGYVDYPPLTPLLSRLEEQIVGTSLTGQRAAPAPRVVVFAWPKKPKGPTD